jgi:hypothetical protein
MTSPTLKLAGRGALGAEVGGSSRQPMSTMAASAAAIAARLAVAWMKVWM